MVSESGCHPFSAGRYSFMHNGYIAGYKYVRKAMLAATSELAFEQVRSAVDSEAMFGLILTEIEKEAPRNEYLSPDRLGDCVRRSIRKLEEICARAGRGAGIGSLLNLVLTDGKSVVVTRYAIGMETTPASLYYAVGTDWVRLDDARGDAPGAGSQAAAQAVKVAVEEEEEEASDEYTMLCSRRHPDVLIVASERLTTGSYWRSVPKNSMMVCDENVVLSILPVPQHRVAGHGGAVDGVTSGSADSESEGAGPLAIGAVTKIILHPQVHPPTPAAAAAGGRDDSAGEESPVRTYSHRQSS